MKRTGKIGNAKIAEHGKKTRFKKGVSGNPKGKPKGISVTQYLRELSDEEIDLAIRDKTGQILRVDKRTRAKAIAIRMLDALMTGEISKRTELVKIYLDRTEGKVGQQIDITSGGAPLDLGKLTIQELKMLQAIQAKAKKET